MEAIKVRVATVIEKDDKFLCVKLVQGSREFWILPGGTLEYGESLTECLIRELKEETHLDIEPQKIIYMRDLIGPGSHSIEIFFYSTIKACTPKLGIDPGSDGRHTLDEVKWLSLVELAGVTLAYLMDMVYCVIQWIN